MSKRESKARTVPREYAVFWRGVRIWTVRDAVSEQAALVQAVWITGRAVTVVLA